MKLLFALFLFVLAEIAHCANRYCMERMKCSQGKVLHTICKNEPCPCHERCGPNFKIISFTEKDRQFIIDKHNEIRSEMSKPYRRKNGDTFPTPALYLMELTWSFELEFMAQCHANTCMTKGEHDVCRKTGLNLPWIYANIDVGQNSYNLRDIGPYNKNKQEIYKKILSDWAEEASEVPLSVLKTFRKPQVGEKSYLNFTQMIWHLSRFIGCANVLYGHGKHKGLYFYCNYTPGGNIIGNNVLIHGNWYCILKQHRSKYSRLCGTNQSWIDWHENFKAPFKILLSDRATDKL